MKFKGKIAPWWYLLIVLLNGFVIGLSVKYGFHYISFFYIVPVIVLDVYLIPVCFVNYISFEKDKLYVKFGLSKEEIPYENIISMQKTSGFCLSYCASMDNVMLRCKKNEKIVVALQDNKGFMDELQNHNKKIKRFI